MAVQGPQSAGLPSGSRQPEGAEAAVVTSAVLTRGALAAAVTVLAAAIAGCGEESPAIVAGPGQGTTGSVGRQGATARTGSFVEAIGARGRAPADGQTRRDGC
jgi:hypothetical protein